MGLLNISSILIFGCITSNVDQEKWVSLFNGKDLNGWEPKIAGYQLGDNHKNTFVVEKGLLRVKYNEYDSFNTKFGHLFYHVPYSYYKLRIEYRFIGNQVNGGPGWALRNNGMMLHSQSAQSMGIRQDFPISIEAQLLGGNGEDERSNLNLCTPGTHVYMNGELLTQHCFNSISNTYHGDRWVTAELIVLGDSIIHHILSRDTVLTYKKPHIGGEAVNGYLEGIKEDGKLLSEGFIALQAESHPTDFKSIKLLNLKGCMDPTADNYKNYFIKSDPGACLYK